ncbi:hypothetical protein P7D22_04075 [Lichenihabitans sp. Uapishka_5]|uniref:hypothetical protein n=1 Tax=Lichenihabitans sp. Uapishka_5 TaxID=3037302 RepID=UPI0029E8173C|nr:hypothetical protein [Lichenihabitans sp. Uapishka_5]MDX7950354.1 hypothetical protein [Lichenihabitans sp. Uapishka_5]
MKIFLVGLWLTLVALGSTYGASLMGSNAGKAEAHADTAALHHEKTRNINVPVIVDGALQGYVGMQFTYVVDSAVLKTVSVPPEPYLMDAAFNDVYMDKTTDFNHLDRMDMPAFTKLLVEQTNARLGAALIKDVLVESFNYTPKNVQD